jgi:putative DNA primase/helicase
MPGVFDMVQTAQAGFETALNIFNTARDIAERQALPASPAFSAEDRVVIEGLSILSDLQTHKALDGLDPVLIDPLTAATSVVTDKWALTQIKTIQNTDQGNGRRLVAHYGHLLHYIYPLKKWLVWDRRRWAISDRGQIEQYAKTAAQLIFVEASKAKDEERQRALTGWAFSSQGASKVKAMLEMARSEVGIPVMTEDLDQHPYLLNVRNGVLDLESNTLLPHDPLLLMTKIVPVDYDPNATCPKWDAWLDRMMGGDQDTVRYLQQIAGISLSGHDLQAIFIFYGAGANGKTTFLETISQMLGDYAVSTKPETLMVRRNESTTDSDLVVLRGARLVTATEPTDGMQLNEAKIKALTGGDTISAEPKYADPITFRPEFKLILGTNHKPVLKGTDHGIRRRVKMVPWAVQIPDSEKNERYREEVLYPELEGILAWAMRGYQIWKDNGRRLVDPSAVSKETQDYFAEQDVIGLFFDDECVQGLRFRVGTSDLYDAYKIWAERNGRGQLSSGKFSTQMQERGFEHGDRLGNGRMTWAGVGLKSNVTESPPGPVARTSPEPITPEPASAADASSDFEPLFT